MICTRSCVLDLVLPGPVHIISPHRHRADDDCPAGRDYSSAGPPTPVGSPLTGLLPPLNSSTAQADTSGRAEVSNDQFVEQPTGRRRPRRPHLRQGCRSWPPPSAERTATSRPIANGRMSAVRAPRHDFRVRDGCHSGHTDATNIRNRVRPDVGRRDHASDGLRCLSGVPSPTWWRALNGLTERIQSWTKNNTAKSGSGRRQPERPRSSADVRADHKRAQVHLEQFPNGWSDDPLQGT